MQLLAQEQRNICEGKQEWHLDQWTDSSSKSLIRVGAEDRHAHGNGQFLTICQPVLMPFNLILITHEVVRCRREALDCSLFIASLVDDTSPTAGPQPHAGECPAEHDGEVQDKRDDGTEYRTEIVENVPSLLCEDDNNSVQ